MLLPLAVKPLLRSLNPDNLDEQPLRPSSAAPASKKGYVQLAASTRN